MSLSAGVNINTDPNIEKFYGMQKQQLPEEKDSGNEVKVVPHDQNLSGVSWSKDEKGEVKLDNPEDKVTLASTTVSLERTTSKNLVISALSYVKEKLDQQQEKMLSKLLEAYEAGVRASFGWEALSGRDAIRTKDSKKGPIDRILAALVGVFADKGRLEEIRTRVQTELRAEHPEKLAEVMRAEVLGDLGIC